MSASSSNVGFWKGPLLILGLRLLLFLLGQKWPSDGFLMRMRSFLAGDKDYRSREHPSVVVMVVKLVKISSFSSSSLDLKAGYCH